MTDNTFQPAQITVRKGQTLTLRFQNNGSVKHEAIIGDAATQDRHETEMSSGEMDHGNTSRPQMNGMDHGNTGGTPNAESPSAITVEPGQTGDLTYTFDEGATLLIGCHEPGHWKEGMKATITIA